MWITWAKKRYTISMNTRKALIAFIVIAFAGGGFWYYRTGHAPQPASNETVPFVSPTGATSTGAMRLPTETPHVTPPTTPPPSVAIPSKPVAITSGIRGSVFIGPTCPVQRNPPDPACADRVFAANFRVRNSANVVVKEFSSLDDGTFSVLLPVGTYSIEQMPGALYPRMSSQTMGIVVKANQFTAITITFDTGIR